MNLSTDKVTGIFYLADEFCIQFDASISRNQIGNAPKLKPRMSTSEVITLMALFHFHSGSFRNMKHFYIHYIQKHVQSALLPMAVLLKTCCLGDCTGISFIDSTPIRVCKNKRIKRNKVFKNAATVGKSTMGYFFGFKLHLVVNDKGKILNFVVTQGHADDI